MASPNDLAKLVMAANHNELIREYSTTPSYAARVGKQLVQFHNTDPLVRDPDWQVSVQKTGHIAAAGQCLVLQALIDGRNVVIVLLNSIGKYTRVADARRIRQWLAMAELAVAGNGARRILISVAAATVPAARRPGQPPPRSKPHWPPVRGSSFSTCGQHHRIEADRRGRTQQHHRTRQPGPGRRPARTASPAAGPLRHAQQHDEWHAPVAQQPLKKKKKKKKKKASNSTPSATMTSSRITCPAVRSSSDQPVRQRWHRKH